MCVCVLTHSYLFNLFGMFQAAARGHGGGEPGQIANDPCPDRKSWSQRRTQHEGGSSARCQERSGDHQGPDVIVHTLLRLTKMI